jgi:hypothetical protein
LAGSLKKGGFMKEERDAKLRKEKQKGGTNAFA